MTPAQAADTRPWRVVVAGTNFGRVHVGGVASRPAEFTLAGILSRGSAYSRRYAAELGVPHFTQAAELPENVDAVCVAVGSAVSGGRGAELAIELLGRGKHVLAEHPMHVGELTDCLRAARKHGVQFRISTHYPHVAPVRTFLAAAERLRGHAPVLFVDAATPVHVLQPLLDILGRALGGLRPWAFADPNLVPPELVALTGGPGPLQALHGVVAGVPLTMRVHNQLHPADRDNHALLWHRVALGTDAGVLTLADTHGPVLWSPRFHAERDNDRRLVLDGPGAQRLSLPSASVIGPAQAESFADLIGRIWPDAVARALTGLRDAATAEVDPLREGQFDLTVSRMWAELSNRIGPPASVRRAAPRPLTAAELTASGEPPEAKSPPTQPTTPAPRPAGKDAQAGAADAAPAAGPCARVRAGYGPTAEFFELAAADHATRSAPAVAAALSGLDVSHGPVVDIGAGTGLVTAAIATALPGARILATEPSAALRAVLTSRVIRNADLRSRVTVVPEPAQELTLPDRLSGAVLCGVVGHLDEAERRALWRQLAQRMPSGAPIIVELMGVQGPVRMPPTRLTTAQMGRMRYEWWFAIELDVAGDTSNSALRLRSTWRIEPDGAGSGQEVSEEYRWFAFPLQRLAEESGMAVRELPTPLRDSAPLGMLTVP